MTLVNRPDTVPAEGALDAGGPPALTGRRRTWALLRADRGWWIGVSLLAAIVAASTIGPMILGRAEGQLFRDQMPLDGSALPPNDMFLLGTDRAGHDLLSELMYAGRATLMVGIAANLAAVVFGTLVGLVAGYVRVASFGSFRGRRIDVPVESLLMRVTDIALAFPVLLLAIAVTTVVRPSLAVVALVIASVLWTTTARLVHTRVVQVRSADFITAAVAQGVGERRIIRRQILPHVAPLVSVLLPLGVATTILFEASLSYLGAGAPASSPTWGFMITDGAASIRSDPRLPLLPGLAIACTVLAFTLIGDAIESALDPRRTIH
jgi:peptide/nickel transport system permease protein